MWDQLKEKNIKLPVMDWKEINQRVDPVLRQMEKVGIELDVKFLNKMAEDVEVRLKKTEKQIFELAGEEFNIGSPMQMAEILYKKLHISTNEIRKTKSAYSTAAAQLKKLEEKHKIIKPILEYRELSKLLNTYLKPLPLLVDKNSRLHTTYGQDTSTGRLTSCEPNLQNIPIRGEWGGEVRKAFVASNGMTLISADYSQIELRVVACLAGDIAMIDAFSSGIDIHSRTAAEIFNTTIEKVTSGQRRVAKTVNFGVLYGMSPYGLSQALKIDQEKAAEYINKYFTIHAGIKNYCQKMIDFACKNGYVETLFGFKKKLSNINATYPHNVAMSEERMAINAPVQGTAAEILKLAMIELNNRLNSDSSNKTRILLTVHDEIVVECPKQETKKVTQIVKETMENVISLCVPMKAEVKVGKSWGDMKKVSF